ncbi:MAG: glycosyltransferase family 4 protein [Candidatus Andersenbacteria bacterium]
MRVAFIHSGYSRHLVSGIIRVETELVRALRARGHVAEIMPWREDQDKALVQQQYWRIVRPASSIYREVRDFITVGQYDLVVFQGVGYPETRALPWLKRETKAKFVVVQHGWSLYSPTTRFLVNSYMQAVGHILLAQADAIVAVSNYVKSHLATYSEPERIQVIYPGVDTERFTQRTPHDKALVRQRLGVRQPQVLFANGKLAAHKNIATLLRALQELPEAELLLVGSGSTTKEKVYKDLAQTLGVAARVQFLGTVANERLPELYNAADLFVHAARSEALGIVLLEALACQLPAVAPDVGGISEAVISGFSGQLYQDPRDHLQLAQQVRELLANPERRAQFGRNGRAYVKARFDWSTVIPQYLQLFERVIKAPRQTELQPQDDGVFGAFA